MAVAVAVRDGTRDSRTEALECLLLEVHLWVQNKTVTWRKEMGWVSSVET